MSSQDATDARELTPRQRQILTIVQQIGFTTIETLAERFGVSAQTVRRDIIQLQAANYLQRFHGGAGLASGGFRSAYAQKLTVSPQGKQRIGAAVAGIVPAGASVFLDVGTTVEAAARALLDKPGLRVVTASVSVAQIFCQHGIFDVFVTGGTTRGANGSLVGQAAIACTWASASTTPSSASAVSTTMARRWISTSKRSRCARPRSAGPERSSASRMARNSTRPARLGSPIPRPLP